MLIKIDNSDYNKLKDLNYSKETIKETIDKNLTDTLLNNKYSKTLDIALQTNTFEEKYIDLYFELDDLDDKRYIEKINVLSDLGYSLEDIKYLFDNMNYEDLEYISSIEYIENLKTYLEYDGFNLYKFDRYKNYRNLNPNMNFEDIVWHVNIDLDKEPYLEFKIIDDVNSELILVNKYNKLPDNYTPTDLEKINTNYAVTTLYLRSNARKSFESMCSDARGLGLYISAISTYRTKDYQENLYNSYVRKNGVSSADTYSARPRFSEHETGLAVDVMGSNKNYLRFKETNEYVWLKDNAHNYGFIIRYQEDKVDITKYMFEAWHYRYVGKDVATYIYENDMTLEEYIAKNNKIK